MTTNTKATPKSCSCRACRAARSSERKKPDERRYRHAARIQLAKCVSEDNDTPLPAPHGERNG